MRDLSFAVQPGEVLGLVGPNGAGKTTTLRCLAGIIPATAARRASRGTTSPPTRSRRSARWRFSRTNRGSSTISPSGSTSNFVARIYGVANHEALAQPLLEELEIADKADQLPGELSRGMKQKLAIACGLLHSPRVMFFDEPLTGLDPLGIRRMKDSILKRARDGAAIVLSSHLLQPARGSLLARAHPEKRRENRRRHARGGRRALQQRRTEREPRGNLHPRHRRLGNSYVYRRSPIFSHVGRPMRIRITDTFSIPMVRALLYLRLTSLKNSRGRPVETAAAAEISFRRDRRALAYFWFFFFRHIFGGPPRPSSRA